MGICLRWIIGKLPIAQMGIYLRSDGSGFQFCEWENPRRKYLCPAPGLPVEKRAHSRYRVPHKQLNRNSNLYS